MEYSRLNKLSQKFSKLNIFLLLTSFLNNSSSFLSKINVDGLNITQL